MSNQLQHHGVKGMKWGVRRVRKETSNPAKSDASKSKKENIDKPKSSKPVSSKTKQRVAKTVVKGKEVVSRMLMASLVDDVFYGGAGKKIAKEAVVQTGRAAVTAYIMARGGYDIKWYDKQGRRVG